MTIQQTTTDHRRNKRLTLLSLLLVWFLGGVGEYFLDHHTGAYSAYSVCLMILSQSLIVLWFTFDAAERDYRAGKGLYVMLFAVAVLAAPYYFIRTRGGKAIVSIILSILFVCSWRPIRPGGMGRLSGPGRRIQGNRPLTDVRRDGGHHLADGCVVPKAAGMGAGRGGGGGQRDVLARHGEARTAVRCREDQAISFSADLVER